MNLSILDNRFLVDLAVHDLFGALKKSSKKYDKCEVVYNINMADSTPYFHKEADIYYLEDYNFWFSRSIHLNKCIYAFGLNEPLKSDFNSPICVFDFPKNGSTKDCLGIFSRNNKGIVFILHKGTSNGINKELYEKFKEKIVEVDEWDKKAEYICISALKDPNIQENFKEYLSKIKDLNTEKENKESSTSTDNSLKDDEIVFALKGISEIKKSTILNPFFKFELENKIDPNLLSSYLKILKKYKLIKELKFGRYVLKPDSEILEFEKKYKKSPIKHESKILDKKQESSKECNICGQTLSLSKFYKLKNGKGYYDKCKDCKRKSYAVKCLIEIEKIVDINSPFYKKDLLKIVDNHIQYQGYIWTLQEFNLLKYDEKSGSYLFKPKEELDTFKRKYGDEIPEEESKTESPKVVKKCNLCKESLSISKFYKSRTSKDGYSENCKECTDKIKINKILTEIQKYVELDEPFNKDTLLKHINNSMKIDSYIWTLQDHDLIKELKTGAYIINKEKVADYKILPKKPDKDTEKKKTTLVKQEPLPEEKTIEYPQEVIGELIKKEIIYISENNGNSTRNLVLRGIIKKEDIFSSINSLQSIILDQNKIFISKFNEDLSDIMVELEVKNESLNHVLETLLNDKWKNKTVTAIE